MVGLGKKTLWVGLILCFSLFIFCKSASAKDFGVMGKVNPIKEEDLLHFIKKRLKTMQASGELQKINSNFRKRSYAKIMRPKPVKGITHTRVDRVFYFDPTIEITKTITDTNGNIIAKKGDKLNPLKYVKLTKWLVFIDGDDKAQVKWALDILEKRMNTKIVLISGSAIELMKKLKKKFYFDQYGKITSHFGIEHVPSFIKQKGLKLEIKEVAL